MDNTTEQTIRQYARISEIPLKKILDDLKILGFSINANDVLSKKMRQKLSSYFRQQKNAEVEAAELKQTVFEYTQILGVTLEQTLTDLKNLGFSCHADDVPSKDMRQEVLKLSQKRLMAEKVFIKQSAEAKARKFFLPGQTLTWYASIYDISAEVALEDLKNYRYSFLLPPFRGCVDDFIDQKRHSDLAAVILKRLIRKPEIKAFRQVKKELEFEVQREERKIAEIQAIEERKIAEIQATEERKIAEIQATEERKIAEIQASKVMEMLKEIGLLKIGQLIDVCFFLVPTNIRVSLVKTTNIESIYDLYIENYYQYIRYSFLNEHIGGHVKLGYKKLDFPSSIITDYDLITNNDFLYDDIISINKKINELKKQKRYTAALVNIIYFLMNFHLVSKDLLHTFAENNYKYLDFQVFSFIGELLIDIGTIDGALKLYAIDERIFNNPNRLSLLVNSAVRIGNLESSVQLITKLIEQEPYHPSIPIMQAEIKRLEQRDRLKMAFSIDFSKVNELSGVEFENLLLDKFIAMGFKAEATPKTGDYGADLIVENKEGTRIIVQCKRFKSKVNLKAVQEVVGAIGHYAGDLGIVITNNSFLNSAVKLAESHDIELWDGDKLVSFLAGDLSFSEIIGISQ